jgi:HEPN domain-containing protein
MNKVDLVREWFEFASNDLKVAAHLFESMHKKPLEIICYHCQQAVEKVMKGYLIYNDVEPPYVHDLTKWYENRCRN